MRDVHALVGPYAVDAVDDLERAAFERHRAGCEDCRRELAGLRETAATLAADRPVPPPDRLRAQVLAGIEGIRPLPPEMPADRPRRASSRWRSRPAALVAAAAAVLALGTGAVVWQQLSDDRTSQAPPAASPLERVREARDAEEYTKTLDGIEVTVVRSRSLNQAVVVTEGMPPPPRGKVYELWLDHRGVGMVPAGLMDAGGTQQLVLEGDPATAIGAGITIEPEGGSDEPTTEPMMAFTFETA